MSAIHETMKELTQGYTIKNGIIKNPGKFEGESIATLYYYDCFLNGGDVVFEISQEERESFKIGDGYKYVYLYESEYGFVHLYYYGTQAEAEAANRVESEDFEDF